MQLQGFHWRTGIERVTSGIWMWGEPIMIEAAGGETYAIVLVSFFVKVFFGTKF